MQHMHIEFPCESNIHTAWWYKFTLHFISGYERLLHYFLKTLFIIAIEKLNILYINSLIVHPISKSNLNWVIILEKLRNKKDWNPGSMYLRHEKLMHWKKKKT